MRKRTLGCLVLLALFVILAGGLAYWLPLRLEEARSQVDLPMVTVESPRSEALPPAGSHIPVIVSATSRSPLVRMELWLDGDLQATKPAKTAGGSSDTEIFDVVLPEGTHMVLARAVNEANLIGTSQALGLEAKNKPSAGEPRLVVAQAKSGQTLSDVAGENHTDAATLQQLNPGLPGGQLQPNTGVVVPGKVPAVDDGQTSPPSISTTGPSTEADGDNDNLKSAKGSSPSGKTNGPVTVPDVPPVKVIDPATLNVSLQNALQVVGLFRVARPPAAPTDLQGDVNNCKVRLVWNDNADNETGYDVWMGSGTLPARIIGSFGPAGGGAAWLEFPAPQPGLVTFWVEAVNQLGRQSSNPVSISIDSTCPSTLATQLTVNLIDITESGNADRVYCYVSYEGAPQFRLPLNDFQFVPMSGKRGTFPPGAVPTLPPPTDGKLDLNGECWGWSGKALAKMGAFSGQLGIDAWNGQVQTLDGQGFQIHLMIGPQGTLKPGLGFGVTYDYLDTSMPIPYDVKEEGFRCAMGPGDCGPADRLLVWKWEPTAKWNKPLTGFKIYLNGEPFADVVGGDKRSFYLTLPKACDMRVSWRVAAVAGEAHSLMSIAYEYDLPPCQAYISARFETIDFLWTHDGAGSGGPGNCDDLDGYGTLSLDAAEGGVAKNLPGGKGGTFHIWCRALSVAGMAPSFTTILGLGNFFTIGYSQFDPYPDTLVLPIPSDGVFSVEARDKFWDSDTWSSDDPVADNDLVLNDVSYQSLLKDWECGKSFYVGMPYHGDWEGQAVAHITMRVYPGPSACNMEAPPKIANPNGSGGFARPKGGGWSPDSGDPTMEQLILLAKFDLSKRTMESGNTFTVTKASRMDWGDAGLGCSSGRTSAVIVPGYLIGLMDPNGKEYEYHTSMTDVLYCPNYFPKQ